MPAFFAANWFRVAGLRPKLLPDLRVERQRYGRQVWYSLHDRLSGRVHRVSPAAFLFAVRLDGQRTVDEVWQALVAEMDADAPSQEAVIHLLMQLHGADLLAGNVPPDAAELLSRRDRFARSLLSRNARSPLSVQVPVFDPDRMLTRLLPFLRPLLGWPGLLAWLGLVVAGAATAAQHWTELTQNVSDQVLAGQGLLAMALCYPVIKALHELGHGIVAKHFGCEVRETGVMLLILFPVPYVDASNSSALPSKWQRAGVAAAGIAVELGLAAVAALVWASAEPGLLRAVAYNVMLIGGASTLLVNGNPLLRFDGYYVLSDVLGVPNLGQRATQYFGHLFSRYAFGLRDLRGLPASAYERAVMLVYAPISWCYRTVMMVSVALFVASSYFVVGVVLAVMTPLVAIVWPCLRTLGRVVSGPAYTGRRVRAVCVTFGAIAALGLAMLVLPVPVHGNAQGVVWLDDVSLVRARTDGFVRRIDAQPGTVVGAGATLFTLQHAVADARMRVTAARVQELRAKAQAEWVTDRITAGVTTFELAEELADLAREQRRQAHSAVLAGADGVFTAARPGTDEIGRFVKEGELMGWVTPPAGLVARVLVPQADVGLVQGALRGLSVRLADGVTAVPSSVLRAVPAAADDLPSPAFATGSGGTVATDPRSPQRLRAMERHFQIDVSLPPDAAARFGSRVAVRFDFGWEPVGKAIYRRVRQGLLSRFET